MVATMTLNITIVSHAHADLNTHRDIDNQSTIEVGSGLTVTPKSRSEICTELLPRTVGQFFFNEMDMR